MRATDYKTGKPWAPKGALVARGTVLQPVLYALALEKLLVAQPVEAGRLYYCTHAGGYEERVMPLDQAARGSIDVLLAALGPALAEGAFPALPLLEQERAACERCDYLSVCGPGASRRAQRKERAGVRKKAPRWVALGRLRELP